MSQVVSLSFFRFGSLGARLWALSMMGIARPAMARVPGIGFWKLCGSGTGEGFTPLPNTAVYAILATWPDRSIWPDAAKMANFARTGAHAEAIQAVRAQNWFKEELYARFHVLSDSGSWNGTSPLTRTDEL